MSDDFEDFTVRQSTMEPRVTTLEAASDAHAVKLGDHEGLLIAMDKDVSDAQAAFRAQLAVLNSVRETQNEHTTALRELRTGQGQLRRELTEVRVGVQTIISLLSPAGDGEEFGGKSPN
jgi:hypothetical protein